ncbi:MAG: hypothetical protein WEA56_03625 [Balneolaceae bacterium]
MNKISAALLAILFLFLLVTAFWQFQRVQSLEEEVRLLSENAKAPALHVIMGNMQTYLHKLSYAVENEQKNLTDFYLHELEELSTDIIQQIPIYDGFPVGDLVSVMLLPVLEETEEALEENDWDLINERSSAVIQACNNCHSSTDHGFIKITGRAGQNPFNQNFSTP